MRYSLAGKTDRGAVREHNEDAVDWHCDEDGDWALAVVADGMGGYSGGEVASSLAVDLYVQLVREQVGSQPLANVSTKQMAQWQRKAAITVNQRIKSEQQLQPELVKMGSTLLAGLVWRKYLSLIHAGDSRCYRWRQGKLAVLTRDHTYVEEMIERGDMTADDAREHPYRHVLTRALGSHESFDFTVTTHEVEPGDRYMFCSDGLHNTLSPATFKTMMGDSPEPGVAANLLVDAAKEGQANDNVSVVTLYAF